jgi:predicted nucleotidyltransferase
MNIFFDEHRKLIKDMLDEGVFFLLIGGYAVNYHGYNRSTGDMDIWLKPDNENKERFIKALAKNDIAPEDLEQLSQADFTHTIAFGAWEHPHKVDFLTKVSGISFDEAYRERVEGLIEGLAMPFINLNHLVLSKTATGRAQDKADIENLQEVQRKKEK